MVDLDSITIDPAVLGLIPRSVAAERFVIPLFCENGTITVAIGPDTQPQVLADIAFLVGKKVKTEVVRTESLERALVKFYGNPQRAGAAHQDQVAQTAKPDLGESSAVGLVNRVIAEAIKLGASDIHVEPYERTFRIRYRIDGVLH